MCVMSNVLDYGRTLWPYANPMTDTPAPTTKFPTTEQWEAFMKLVELAQKFDKIASQPDCEDPEKVAWMRDIEDRLAKLENPYDTNYSVTDVQSVIDEAVATKDCGIPTCKCQNPSPTMYDYNRHFWEIIN